MPKVFTSKTQKTGEIGENIAVRFLVKQDFEILDRNYTKKWGEIDIVAIKDEKLHFIEVKSKTVLKYALERGNVNRETIDKYEAEENMHPWKLKRLSRVIQTYLLSKNVSEDREWQVDLIVVFLDIENKKAKIKLVNDIIL